MKVIRPLVLDRVAAKMIDLLIVFSAAILFPYPIGPLMGFIYSLFADGINSGSFRGQSVGKKVMKLQVVYKTQGETPAHFRESVLRNAPVGVATFFGIIPIWGWLILGVIGLPLLVMEVSLMLRVKKGRRLGDIMADTEVIQLTP